MQPARVALTLRAQRREDGDDDDGGRVPRLDEVCAAPAPRPPCSAAERSPRHAQMPEGCLELRQMLYKLVVELKEVGDAMRAPARCVLRA